MVVVGPTRDVVVVVDLAWCSDGGGGSGTVLCWWLRHMVRVTPMCSMVVAPTCGGGHRWWWIRSPLPFLSCGLSSLRWRLELTPATHGLELPSTTGPSPVMAVGGGVVRGLGGGASDVVEARLCFFPENSHRVDDVKH